MKGPPNDEIDSKLRAAERAYRDGNPVLVYDDHHQLLHGQDYLDNIAALQMAPVKPHVVSGVPAEYRNDSDWPEKLKAAHDTFFLGRTGD
jgi:hypothetical protein